MAGPVIPARHNAHQHMIRFIIRRILGAVVVLFVVSLITFLIFQLAPMLSHTNPVYYYIGKVPFKPGSPQLKRSSTASASTCRVRAVLALPRRHHLRPVDHRRRTRPVALPAPCFGYSFQQNDARRLADRSQACRSASAWPSAPRSCGCVGGVSVGTFSGLQPRLDHRPRRHDACALGRRVAADLLHRPGAAAGLRVQAGLADGHPRTRRSPSNPLQWFKSMILPWIALAFLFAALYARLTRANMLETMGEDYIRTARAKGLPRRTVVIKHGLRAALTPIVTIFGIDLGTAGRHRRSSPRPSSTCAVSAMLVDQRHPAARPSVIMGVTIVAALPSSSRTSSSTSSTP